MLMHFICKDDSLVKGPPQLLAGHVYQVGRSSKCAFVLSERSVSRVHAELEVHTVKLLVRDLKSRNGIYVDGERVAEAELKPGQKVNFGCVTFHLVNGDVVGEVDGDALSHASTFVVRGRKPTIFKLLDQLSDAERRVFEQLKKGLAEKEAAANLALSVHTIRNHAKAIYRKLNVKSRSELLALFVAESDLH